jgi:hypothetical protein
MLAWATAVPGATGHPGRADAWRYVLLPRSSTVEVAAAPPAVRLRPELAFQLHQAPDPGAVGADVGLDVGGRFIDGGEVDAEQLRAPLQRRRDWPSQARVVPRPHRFGSRSGGALEEVDKANPQCETTSVSAGYGVVVGLPGLEPGTSSGVFRLCGQRCDSARRPAQHAALANEASGRRGWGLAPYASRCRRRHVRTTFVLAGRATRVPHRAGNPGTERTTTVTCTPRGPRQPSARIRSRFHRLGQPAVPFYPSRPLAPGRNRRFRGRADPARISACATVRWVPPVCRRLRRSRSPGSGTGSAGKAWQGPPRLG